jgi:DNA-directed RNA polymerase I, II, and III subunit RPABC2
MSSEGFQVSLEEIPDNVLSENIDDTAAPISLGSGEEEEEAAPEEEEAVPEEEEAAPEEEEAAPEEEEGAVGGKDGFNMLGEETIAKLIVSDDEGESDDDEEDEGFFQKLENEINANELLDYHPEIKQNNYQEVKALCKVTRDKRGNIIDPLHKTIPFLTKYEKARVLGVRCKQISNGADPFIEVPPNMINGMLIAEKELYEKVLPFIIRRPLPNGGSEYWHMSDLELIEY